MESIQVSSKLSLQALYDHVEKYDGIIDSQLRALCLVLIVSKCIDIT